MQEDACLGTVHIWLATPPCIRELELQQGVWNLASLSLLNATDIPQPVGRGPLETVIMLSVEHALCAGCA